MGEIPPPILQCVFVSIYYILNIRNHNMLFVQTINSNCMLCSMIYKPIMDYFLVVYVAPVGVKPLV